MKSTILMLLALVFGPSFALFADEPAPASTEAKPAASAPAASATATATTPTTTKVDTSEKKFTGPAAELKSYMDDLLQASRDVNQSNATQRNAARGKIEQALDWDAIAQACLGASEWKHQSAANRASFRNLLKDVILRTAYSRMDKFWKGATASIDKIDVKGSKAEVFAKFLSNGEKLKLSYFFHEQGKKWKMNDVAYNGMRYSVNINDQIDAFLREKNFNELLQKLRKRRDELVSDAKSDAR